ncbi:MAG: A/G-specific adenine glycosylase [Spartobacteria bacterium]
MIHSRSTIDIRGFRTALRPWFRRHGRDLPWRRTRDPYAILVSEFMLQQTQVTAVIPFYHAWLRRFTTFAALAAATENDVLHAWQGLGYYARARNLHAAAKAVQDRHGGIFPRDIDSIRALPGIGRYTANAVATFAFDQSVPIVEANTARLLARLFNIDSAIDSAAGREKLWHAATMLVPKQNAGHFNSALIDLGATVCLPRAPKCGICPAKTLCLAPNPETLPIKKERLKTKTLIENHALITTPNKILLQQSTDRWRGLWTLPPLNGDCFKQSTLPARAIHTSIFPFTHHRITLRVFRQTQRKIDNRIQRWFSRNQLNSIPMPSPHRRALLALLH